MLSYIRRSLYRLIISESPFGLCCCGVMPPSLVTNSILIQDIATVCTAHSLRPHSFSFLGQWPVDLGSIRNARSGLGGLVVDVNKSWAACGDIVLE